MTSWLNSIEDINLRESVQQLLSVYPDSLSVVQNLINYYNDKLRSTMLQDNGREHKKRKLDSSTITTINEQEEQKTIIINDISFQLPARKKYNLIFTSTRRLYLMNTKTDEMDYTFDLNQLEQICCVPSPVPIKGHTFTLFFKQQPMDPIVFTIQQKGDIIIIQPQQPKEEQQQSIITDDKEKHIIQILSEQTNHEIQLPSKSFYLSTVISATTGKRPDEDRFYANVYLKNKEACLYFLPKGILFGFKKPVYYFPLTILSSTFYSGITQHTFNLTLVLKNNNLPLGSLFNISKDHGEQESGSTLEFSMIEQSEFGGIDQYIKKMNINDKSMSEENMAPETKAKKQQQNEEDEEEGKTRTTLHDNNNNNVDYEDDDDEENDDDFEPSDDDDEPLEYDTDAGSSQQESSDDDNDDEEEDDDMMDEDIRIETSKKRPIMDGIDEIDDSKDEGEQDITKTDNEEEEEEEEDVELNEEEDEEELQEDDAESESLGSSSEDDIDEDMRDAKSRTIIPEDAKDELEDSD